MFCESMYKFNEAMEIQNPASPVIELRVMFSVNTGTGFRKHGAAAFGSLHGEMLECGRHGVRGYHLEDRKTPGGIASCRDFCRS